MDPLGKVPCCTCFLNSLIGVGTHLSGYWEGSVKWYCIKRPTQNAPLFSPKGQRDDFSPQHAPSWCTSFVSPCLWAPGTFHQVFSGSLCTCFSFLGWMLTSENRGHGCFVSPCLALGRAWRGSRCEAELEDYFLVPDITCW